MADTCPKCGGEMEAGIATAFGLLGDPRKDEPRLQFVVPGVPTSLNPITAFKQGLNDEPANRGFKLIITV